MAKKKEKIFFKLNKNHKVLLAIIGAFLILASLPTKQKSEELLTVTGVIRESRLMDEEKQEFGLEFSQYQITDFENAPKNIQGMFIEDDISDKYVGKCVTLSGTVPVGWEPESKPGWSPYIDTSDYVFTYNRLAIIPEKIDILEYSDCNPVFMVTEGSFKQITLQGTLNRGDWGAPDVGYNYLLNLENNIENYGIPNASGLPTSNVYDVPVVPTSKEMWIEFENNIGKEVEITGEIAWGYSESTYVSVLKVK